MTRPHAARTNGHFTEAAARGAESPQGDTQSPMPTKIHTGMRPRDRESAGR